MMVQESLDDCKRRTEIPGCHRVVRGVMMSGGLTGGILFTGATGDNQGRKKLSLDMILKEEEEVEGPGGENGQPGVSVKVGEAPA